MKLSEAIRLGAMMRPQCQGGKDDGVSACALLGASLAVGIDSIHSENFGYRSVAYADLEVRFPVMRQPAACPDCADVWWRNCAAAMHVIWHLNDHHQWTREQIADWVEQIENQQVSGDVVSNPTTQSVCKEQGHQLVGVGVNTP